MITLKDFKQHNKKEEQNIKLSGFIEENVLIKTEGSKVYFKTNLATFNEIDKAKGIAYYFQLTQPIEYKTKKELKQIEKMLKSEVEPIEKRPLIELSTIELKNRKLVKGYLLVFFDFGKKIKKLESIISTIIFFQNYHHAIAKAISLIKIKKDFLSKKDKERYNFLDKCQGLVVSLKTRSINKEKMFMGMKYYEPIYSYYFKIKLLK